MTSNNSTFTSEADFEKALIQNLSERGWEKEVLYNSTEQDLLQNWAKILHDNNKSIDRLGDYPLTDGEMIQIIEQINTLRSPLKLNGFINGKSVSVKRDNPDDVLHCGKEVSLKIYDRKEIAAGQSRYQIVSQPKFDRASDMQRDRRGDVMLLINGMPVIHIELKRSGTPISNACNQIEKYSREHKFRGLFSLVQIFVAMNPEETVYFANPGPDGTFNSDYFFHWADFNNEPINNWKDIASSFLSIPMAHQLIGFYTVADNSDGILKVMRSYQYYAAAAISDKVAKAKKENIKQLGGHVWHTTGSGKTMTSFKSAQLIANSQDADKVVFLMDRIELGTQSLEAYRNFSEANESVQATENTGVLITKLKSPAAADTLIVTSIQKMSNIKEEEADFNAHDLALINAKRLVFIVDEAHRSTFGDMLISIKHIFPNALFFGFTGTPIQDENQKNLSTTTTIFGDELHRYSIADGIRDKNVLGFDPYKVLTYKDTDLRKAVALEKAKAQTVEEAIADPKKSKIYYHYMDSSKIKMYGSLKKDGKYEKGIEDLLPKAQYFTEVHKNKVIEDIADNWLTLSHNGKFHAIFTTNSIREAIEYYRLFKQKMPTLKTTCLFDPNEPEGEALPFKQDGLVEILTDYNNRYDKKYTLAGHAIFKKDLALRLAHKEDCKHIGGEPDKQLDLLIVVEQMLTGFDSKWVNTLYIDKVLKYENIIQAFSRTNRLFGVEKPFGTIRYYRKSHTMEQNILEAVETYSGNKPMGLFVDKLPYNLCKMNECYDDIVELFKVAKIENFEKLSSDRAECAKFASLFKKMNVHLEAAKIQGFIWKQNAYDYIDEETEQKTTITLKFDEFTYIVLAQRYKELSSDGEPGGGGVDDVPYDLVGHLITIDTGVIDANYMNSRFNKYLKLLTQGGVSDDIIGQALAELNKTFAALSEEQQKFANIFLHDVQRGDVLIEEGKSVRDYITEYQCVAKNEQVQKCIKCLGCDEKLLQEMLTLHITESNINEFGRFDALKDTIDKNKAKEYFELIDGNPISLAKSNIKADKLLRDFILKGGFDL